MINLIALSTHCPSPMMNGGDVTFLLQQIPCDATLLAALPWSLRLMELFTIGWFFILGSCFGSFLNVVIYRVPLGMSLGKPDSHCPQCETPILLRDNIPILGWLKLRGRCRSCQVRIPARYPLVEATVALIFLVLLLAEVVSGGITLPLRTNSVRPGVSNTIWVFHAHLMAIYAWHCFLFCVLLAGSLMVFDGHRIPLRTWIWTVAIAVTAPALVTQVHPVPAADATRLSDFHVLFTTWSNPLNFLEEYSFGLWLSGPITSLIGLVAGAAMGRIWLSVVPAHWLKNPDRHGCFFVITITGGFLGWQAVPSVLLLASLVLLAYERRFPEQRRVPWCAFLSLVVLIQVLAWGPSMSWGGWPTPHGWALFAFVSPWWSAGHSLACAFAVATGLMAVTRTIKIP